MIAFIDDHPSAVSAIATTTRWPRRSMASTRPKSSTGVDRGDRSRRSSSPPSNGWIGSTTGGSWSPSATSRRPKPRSATSPYWKSQPWRRDSNQTASGKPGAVHPPPSAAHLLERMNIKLAVREQREVDLLADRSHSSFFKDELASSLPMTTEPAGLRQRHHVGAGIANGAEYAAVLGRQWVGRELRGKISPSSHPVVLSPPP